MLSENRCLRHCFRRNQGAAIRKARVVPAETRTGSNGISTNAT